MKKMAVSILAVMSILTVMFPAVAMWYVDTYNIDTIEHAIEEGGLSVIQSGKYINSLEYENSTQEQYDNLLYSLGWGTHTTKPIITGNEDTIRVAFVPIKAVVSDNITIVADVNYASIETYSLPQLSQYVFHWLNISSHELANDIDALIMKTTSTHDDWGLWFVLDAGSAGGGQPVFPNAIRYSANKIGASYSHLFNDTYTISITAWLKLELLANPDAKVWFYYTELNTSETTYSFNIEIADTTNIFSFQPIILIETILIFITVIMGIFTLFATDTIDIKFGK